MLRRENPAEWKKSSYETPHGEENVPRAGTVPIHGNMTLKVGVQRAIMREAGLTGADL